MLFTFTMIVMRVIFNRLFLGNLVFLVPALTLAAGTWNATGLMNTIRVHHTATLLTNGKVLVVGGYGQEYLASAELYDPITGTWSSTGSMNIARSYHTATKLTNGKVLVAGGLSNDFLSSAELYDPTTGTWSVTGSMNMPHGYHAAVLLTNGKVMVVPRSGTEFSPSNSELYDPTTGTWNITGAASKGRYSCTVNVLANNKVLMAGGTNTFGYRFAGAELYDPDTGIWGITGSMSAPRFDHSGTLLTNGNILVAGGYVNAALTSAELYNPSTGTWINTAAMNVGRSDHTATLLSDGKVLVNGGLKGTGSESLASAELYGPEIGTWSDTGSMITERVYHTATLLANGKVLVTGGIFYSSNGSVVLATAELYTPATVPTAFTNAPSVITSNSARLVGSVNPNGATTTVNFNFGTTTNYGTNIAATPVNIAATAGSTTVSADKALLNCATTYHYRVKAVSSIGTSYGTDKAFTTNACYTDLAITLTDGKTSITAGSTLTYLAVVHNNGPNAANNTLFKAPTVANLNINSVTCSQNTNGAICPTTISVAALQGGLIIPSFPSGSKLTFTIVATVAIATPNSNLVYNVNVIPPSGVVDNIYANNSAKDTDRVVSRPDFIVTNIALTLAEPVSGSSFSAAVTVKNQGGTASNGGVLGLWLNQATAQNCRATADTQISVGNLAVGATKVLTFTGLNAGLDGNKTLRLFVDNTCISAEAVETNNQATKVYSVGVTPDVLITSITLNPSTVAVNGTFSAVVTVKNQGTATTDAGYLDVWANQANTPTCGAEGDAWFDIGNVAAGASKTVTVNGIPAGVTAGTKTLRAFVDSWCETAESNEGNNQLTKSYTVQ